MTPAELWWSQVPHGVQVLEQVENALKSDRMLVIFADVLPWRQDFNHLLKAHLEVANAACPVEVVNGDHAHGLDPLEFLGSCFIPNEIPDKDLIFKSLQEKQVFCLVDGIPEEDTELWLDTLQRFASCKGRSSFRLILEVHNPNFKAGKQISVVDKKIEPFDVYYFSLSSLASMPLRRFKKEYAATLCTEIAGTDAERCASLCANVASLLANPVHCVASSGQESEARLQVCRAQTRAISPLIDIGRLQLLDVFRSQLSSILPYIDDFGNKVNDINSVELRHLMHFKTIGKITMNLDQYSILKRLYEDRNSIAHLDELPADRIDQLFMALEALSLFRPM